MFLTEIVDLSNVYITKRTKNRNLNIITYNFKTDDDYNFSVDFILDGNDIWNRHFSTFEKQFDDINSQERFKILNTITKITLDFIEKYNPKKIKIYHVRSKSEFANNPYDENKRTRVNKYFLEKVLPSNYKIKTFGNNTEIDLVENKLNLKSRAGEQEKQREEYIKSIIGNKDIMELTPKEVNSTFLSKFIFPILINKLKQKFPKLKYNNLFLIDIRNKKLLFFSNGKKFFLHFYTPITTYNGFGEIIMEEEFNTVGELYNKLEEIISDNYNLKENLNLKSRAKEQEKQREEYIKNIDDKILNSPVKDLPENILNLLGLIIRQKVKEKYPFINTFDKFYENNLNFDKVDFKNIRFKNIIGSFSITQHLDKINLHILGPRDIITQERTLKNINIEFDTINEILEFLFYSISKTYDSNGNLLDFKNLKESKKQINEIAELTNTYSYEKIVDGDKIKYRFSDGEEIFFVKFLLLSIGKFGEEWEREYYTTSKWMNELNKENSLRVLGTVTKITNEFINDYRPEIITISHIDSRKETMGRFSIDSILSGNKKDDNEPNKRAKINRLFLSKNLPQDYKLEYKGNVTFIKRKDLNESWKDMLIGTAIGLSSLNPQEVKSQNINQQQIQTKILSKVNGPVGVQSISNPDLDLVHGILGSKRLSDDFEQRVSDELKKLNNQGFKTDVTNIQIKTYVKDNKIITESSCDIIESKDGNSYTIFTTRGSIGDNFEQRHNQQISGLEDRLKNHYGGNSKKIKTVTINFLLGGETIYYKQSFFVVSENKNEQINISANNLEDLRNKLLNISKNDSINLNSLVIDIDNYKISYEKGNTKITNLSLIFDTNFDNLNLRLQTIKEKNPTLKVLSKGNNSGYYWVFSVILKNLNEGLNLKSRANNQIIQSVKYYSDKFLNGTHSEKLNLKIPKEVFKLLSDDVKSKIINFYPNLLKYDYFLDLSKPLKKEYIDSGWGLSDEYFLSLSDDLKQYYLNKILKHVNWNLSDIQYKFLTDDLKEKYINYLFLNPNNTPRVLSKEQVKNTSNELLNKYIGLIIKNYDKDFYFLYPDYLKKLVRNYKKQNIKENLKLTSRANQQEKQRNDYIKNIIGDKSIMDLKPKEVVEVEKIDEHFMDKFIINRIKQKFPNLKHDDNFIYITYDNKPSHITIFVSTRNYFVLRCFDDKKIGTTGLLLDEKFYSVGELYKRLEEIISQNYIP